METIQSCDWCMCNGSYASNLLNDQRPAKPSEQIPEHRCSLWWPRFGHRTVWVFAQRLLLFVVPWHIIWLYHSHMLSVFSHFFKHKYWLIWGTKTQGFRGLTTDYNCDNFWFYKGTPQIFLVHLRIEIISHHFSQSRFTDLPAENPENIAWFRENRRRSKKEIDQMFLFLF